MANLTLEEITEALAEVIEDGSAQNAVVISEKRFNEARADLLRFLQSLTADHTPKGWIISWDELPDQTDDGTGEVLLTYRFSLVYIHPYSSTAASESDFKLEILSVNDALNTARNLGLDNRVRHECLQSTEPFAIVDWDKSKVTHYAEFSLNVTVINTYQET